MVGFFPVVTNRNGKETLQLDVFAPNLKNGGSGEIAGLGTVFLAREAARSGRTPAAPPCIGSEQGTKTTAGNKQGGRVS